jgi:replication-associated recombination protein RarA
MARQLYCEKYRPAEAADVVPGLREELASLILNDEMPNLIFHGASGGGKSAVSPTSKRAFCVFLYVSKNKTYTKPFSRRRRPC